MKNKLKTRNSVQKRFKITKTGKLMFRGSHVRHLRRKKSKSQLRRQKVLKVMTGKKSKTIKKIMNLKI